ncbi:uncharacterized protein LOC123897647 [Trifolium pratense]|uniref:uncharacterized protein LOC123897647 n=1 Tax=Trifolium pratense TaxID=57577 RepID=UPI001E6977E6|nr:uncharacterized protein LOC123897647 [Trifolium pratense]XP_045804319.1 uncharacterized protein LOC123897647 [Trifolium pratense]
MSERKLNINAPLMSVRRNSATSPSLTESKRKILEKRHTLASYKSDMSLDQVTEPVAVPFNWEHIPGRCKGNSGSELPQIPLKYHPPIPRLPPGKSSKSAKQPMEKESNVANKFTSLNKSKSFSGNAVKTDCDREREREKESEKRIESRRSNAKKDGAEEENYDAFSDAVESLSHLTESFSMNCSVSGVSGLDNLEVKKFGTFSTDQQTRDFMMNRFLPAAKAMTLQPSQYSSKKQSVLVEQQPRDVNKLIQNAKKPLVTDIVPYNGICQEEESEDEDGGNVYDDNNNSDNVLGKGCGLLPHLHMRNSLSMLHPVAGTKVKALPSSACEVVKPNKRSNIRSFSPIPAVKKAWEAIHRNKSSNGAASPDMQEGKKKLSSESKRFAYSGELLPGRLSPFRRSRAAATGISPSRSKPQSPFRGAKLPGDSKETGNNYSGNLKFHSSTGLGKIQGVPHQGAKRGSFSGSLAMEKTLYIDNSSTVKLSSSNLSSVDNKRRIDTMITDFDKIRGKERNSSIETSQDIKHVQALDFEEKVTLDFDVLRSLGGNSSTLSGMLHHIAKEYDDEVSKTDQDIKRGLASLQPVQGKISEDSDTNKKQIVLANSSPLPPPLPKSPSESWLWRALPIASFKNSFLHSNQSHAKRNDSNTTSSNVKWETIVKTSNLNHDHVCFSQELPTRKSQHSKY